jgi:hypothetical protein
MGWQSGQHRTEVTGSTDGRFQEDSCALGTERASVQASTGPGQTK